MSKHYGKTDFLKDLFKKISDFLQINNNVQSLQGGIGINWGNRGIWLERLQKKQKQFYLKDILAIWKDNYIGKVFFLWTEQECWLAKKTREQAEKRTDDKSEIMAGTMAGHKRIPLCLPKKDS